MREYEEKLTLIKKKNNSGLQNKRIVKKQEIKKSELASNMLILPYK